MVISLALLRIESGGPLQILSRRDELPQGQLAMSPLHQQVDIVWIDLKAPRAGSYRFLVLPNRGMRLRQLQDQLDVFRILCQRLLGRRDDAFLIGKRVEIPP